MWLESELQNVRWMCPASVFRISLFLISYWIFENVYVLWHSSDFTILNQLLTFTFWQIRMSNNVSKTLLLTHSWYKNTTAIQMEILEGNISFGSPGSKRE
jgi:hypothetical protein